MECKRGVLLRVFTHLAFPGQLLYRQGTTQKADPFTCHLGFSSQVSVSYTNQPCVVVNIYYLLSAICPANTFSLNI